LRDDLQNAVYLDMNESDAQIGTLPPAKVHYRLGDGHFKRGLNRAGQKVAAAERAVLQTKHHMQMETGFAVIALRDITDQAQHLALLAHLDRLVFLGGEIKPADLCRRECTDRRYRRAPVIFSRSANSVMDLKASSP
jgi:hypothetical protein